MSWRCIKFFLCIVASTPAIAAMCPQRIDESRGWSTCYTYYGGWKTCDSHCCCLAGYTYNADTQHCELCEVTSTPAVTSPPSVTNPPTVVATCPQRIDESSDWNTCYTYYGGWKTCDSHCCCLTGYTYKADTQHCELCDVTSTPADCVDNPLGWKDSSGYTCEDYVSDHYCTSDGKTGSGWTNPWSNLASYARNGVDASEACCGCGAKPPELECSRTENKRVFGHGHYVAKRLTDKSPEECKRYCLKTDWCKSFDYNTEDKTCDLTDQCENDIPGNMTTVTDYDHYSCKCETCGTTDVLGYKAATCVFPFTYDGSVYNKCTTRDTPIHSSPWCCTSANCDDWAYCNPSCPVECGTESGDSCILPFNYKGKDYKGCTTDGNSGIFSKAWCCTALDDACSPDGMLSYGWSRCEESCPAACFKSSDCPDDLMCHDGVCKPPKRAFCQGSGDPHIIPFDSKETHATLHITDLPEGTYWIVRSDEVHIQAVYSNGGNRVDALAIGGPLLNGKNLFIYSSGQTTYNGETVRLSADFTSTGSIFSEPSGLFDVQYISQRSPSANNVIVTFSDTELKITVTVFSSSIDWLIEMVQSRNGQDGHCGNFNGIDTDDKLKDLKNRKMMSQPNQNDLLVDPSVGRALADEYQKTDVNDCDAAKRNAAKTLCIQYLQDPHVDAIQGCILDSCSMDDLEENARQAGVAQQMVMEVPCVGPKPKPQGYDFTSVGGKMNFNDFAPGGVACALGWTGDVRYTKCEAPGEYYSVSGCRKTTAPAPTPEPTVRAPAPTPEPTVLRATPTPTPAPAPTPDPTVLAPAPTPEPTVLATAPTPEPTALTATPTPTPAPAPTPEPTVRAPAPTPEPTVLTAAPTPTTAPSPGLAPVPTTTKTIALINTKMTIHVQGNDTVAFLGTAQARTTINTNMTMHVQYNEVSGTAQARCTVAHVAGLLGISLMW